MRITGSRTRKREPRPGALASDTTCPSCWHARLTIESPSPLPGDVVRGSRSNSLKIRSWSAASMPGPASCTVSQASPPARFSPTTTFGPVEYFSALMIRFCAICRSSTGSLSTASEDATNRNSIPRASASGCRSLASRWNSRLIATGPGFALKAWLSSRAMSRSARISSSALANEAFTRCTRSACTASDARSPSCPTNSRPALSGCSRSWLAARRNRDFARLASSAVSRAAASSALLALSSASARSRSALRARTSRSSIAAVRVSA